MKIRFHVFLCIAFITVFANILPLRAGHYYFKQISLKDGLPSTVRCMLTDEQSFVWIGTRSGVGRFDGHELKKYVHHAGNPHSLPNNLILQITEDEQNNIWILTDKGVARYQRQSDDFFLPSDETGKNIIAYSTCLAKDGVWFGSKNKIYFYNYRDNSFRLIQSFDYEPNFNITLMSLWDEHTLLCCSRWQGLILLDLKTGQCTLPPFDCGKEIMSMIVDSKNRKKLKWAMKEHEQQVYEEKVRFLINISHELRTPLTLIHAPLSRILKALSPTDTQYLPLKAIYRQSQRMKNLINMVLDVRKMEVGESKLLIEPHPLNEWIGQVSQDFVSEGEAKNIHIRYQLDPAIETVSFDKDKCEIILSNLLINALKHSPQDTEITISSKLLSAEKRVRISISDQGCGLRQVDTQKLFTRFYQGTGEQNGTGIGLSYSKILVELHGGSIGARDHSENADSMETGATFFFELPLKQQSEEIVCQPKAYLNELMADDSNEQTTDNDSFDTSPFSILVVDDNPDLTEFLKKALGEYFKRVIVAADGVEALQLIKSHTPDIVVSDVMMPRMNGYELCKNIKEDITISHIPVILLTARDDRQSQISGYKNGADAYLTKPFEVEMLMELVRNRLKNRECTKKRYLNAGLIPAPEESTFSQADETFLLKLNKIILENLDNSNLDVPFLCKEIGMSRASLYNKLKALTDMGANDYINKFRMEKAITLIVGTEMTFTEIAEKVGFTTSRYFSTAFKQYTGETPTQYKEKHKKEKLPDTGQTNDNP